jgi:anti-sigma factor RsiW
VNCEEIHIQLDPLVDQELTTSEQTMIMCHVKNCPTCQRKLEELGKLRLDLQQIASTVVPDQLATTLIAAIDSAPLSQAAPVKRRWLLQIVSHSAALITGALVVYLGVLLPPTHPAIKDEVVTAHVRSLMNHQLTQVAAGDPHKVKPWFAGKLDYAPPVADLTASGYPLVGGRIDYLDKRKVATLIYSRREHTINLFVMPASTGQSRLDMTDRKNGYNLIAWQDAGFQYWAMSDLSAKELQGFTRLLVTAKK